MGAKQYNTSSDLYQPEKTTAYDTVDKVGVVKAFFKGVPSSRDSGYQFDPSYQPTTGETIVSTLSDFARSGTAVLAEWTPEYKQARASLDELRKTDPEAADQIEEASIGKKLSNEKLAIKGAAAAGEAALTFLPWFKFGRAGLAAAELGALGKTGRAAQLVSESSQITKNALKLGEGAIQGTRVEAAALSARLGAEEAVSNLGRAGKAFAQSPTLQKLYSGGLNGFLYGGLYGLHANDADWKKAMEGAAVGATFGAGLMGATSGLAFLGKYGGNKALEGFRFGADALGVARDTLGIPKLKDVLPQSWYSNIFSVGSTLKTYYGDIGENFLRMYKRASRIATSDLGKIQLAFIDNGLMKAPSGFGKAFNGVVFVGDDAERMLYYNQVLKGKGAYASKAVRDAAIAADPKLQFLDGTRKDYYVKSKEAGLFTDGLDPDTYLPQHTPVVELTKGERGARGKLLAAKSQAEREAIYAANDPMVKEMVENSVRYEKAFRTLEEAYKTYYDYADLVTGGSHTPMGDNAMLQRMVNRGEAKTIEEARGAIISDLKLLKASLTPEATSLDFKRKVNLPWYDPNPSRVMQQYTMDASMRIEMAKMFGIHDEVINEMIGKVKASLTGEVSADAAARSFEGLVRIVTGQVFYTQKTQRASAFLRAIQIPKLAFAPIMNLGQSLNTLLASDVGSVAHGLTTAFTAPEIRKAIERGVLMNQFVRQIFEHNGAGGGSKFTDAMLKYNGFTFTEMFNRIVGSSASDVWGEKNLSKLFADYGVIKSANELADTAQKQLTADGGSTLNVRSESPTSGYTYAPSKATETKVLATDFNQQHYVGFHNKYKKELGVKGNYLGIYRDGDNIVLDIVQNTDNIKEAVTGAKTGLQDSIYDVSNKDLIFNHEYETAYSNNQSPRQKQGGDLAGGAGSPKELSAPSITPERRAILDRIKAEQPTEYFALQELGIDVDSVIARGSMLPEDKALAAQTFVERTQFLANPSDLPAFASSPGGKIFSQFRTFTYQQARFVTDELKNNFSRALKSGSKEDWYRATRVPFILATVFPMTGEVLADVRSLITQEKRPTKFLDRYIADIFSAGTYGLFYDFATAAEAGKTANFFAGATGTDAIKYLEIIAKAPGQVLDGNTDKGLENLTKQLLRQTGVGRAVVNTVYPSSQPGKSSLKSLMDWAAD